MDRVDYRPVTACLCPPRFAVAYKIDEHCVYHARQVLASMRIAHLGEGYRVVLRRYWIVGGPLRRRALSASMRASVASRTANSASSSAASAKATAMNGVVLCRVSASARHLGIHVGLLALEVLADAGDVARPRVLHVAPPLRRVCGRLGVGRNTSRRPHSAPDEPASNLDALNEHALRRAIEVAAESRTMLVVAHRLATVADADQIVVLDRGAGRRHRPPPRTHRLQPPLPRTCCPSTPDKLTAAANVALARLLVKLGGTRHRCALVTASMREEGCRCLGL